MKPKRIQRKRLRGWRLPSGAVCVTRPGKWGNPYRVGKNAASAAHSVALFQAHLRDNPALVAEARDELAGHDLACWCALDSPCHATVLLEIANQQPGENAQ